METSYLLWSVLFSAVGLGLFIFGRKQRQVIPLMCGIGLMALPYIIPTTTLLVIASIGLIAITYFVRI
jgi:hypothetical protein